jgi:phosphate starvation-inducible membrane PsiE
MKIDKKLLFPLLGIIGSILLIVGSCLAWAIITNLPAGNNTIYGYSLAEGAMLLIIGFLGLIASIITAAYPAKITAIFMVIIGIVSLLTCIIDMASLKAMVYGTYPPASPVEAGIGLYLCLIGSILILVAGLIFLWKALKKKV